MKNKAKVKEELTDVIHSIIAEYSNDMWEGESFQRWKSCSEVTEHIVKQVMKVMKNEK